MGVVEVISMRVWGICYFMCYRGGRVIILRYIFGEMEG